MYARRLSFPALYKQAKKGYTAPVTALIGTGWIPGSSAKASREWCKAAAGRKDDITRERVRQRQIVLPSNARRFPPR